MMSKRPSSLFLSSVFLFFIFSFDSASGNEPVDTRPVLSQAESQKMSSMDEPEEIPKMNLNMQVLGAMVGKWIYKAKWWESADGEPVVSVGKSNIEWKHDGIIIEQEAVGSSDEHAFEGMGVTGYDVEEEEFSSVWIDNTGTGIMTGSGKYDPGTRTISEHGVLSCPLEKEKNYRVITRFVDRDSFTYELYSAGPDGVEFLNMEIVYRRNK